MEARAFIQEIERCPDGQVGIARLSVCGHVCPSLSPGEVADETDMLLAFVRVGAKTLHPLKANVPGEFVVVFKVDPSLEKVFLTQGGDAQDGVEKLQKIVQAAVVERALLGENRLDQVVLVDPSGGFEILQGGDSKSSDDTSTSVPNDHELDLSLIEEILAERRICTANIFPVASLSSAKNILATLSAKELFQVPLLVAYEDGLYVGQSFAEKEYTLYTALSPCSKSSSSSSSSCGTTDPVAEQEPFDSPAGIPTLDWLSRNLLSSGGMVGSTTCRACYDLLGSCTYARGSCVSLIAEWETQRSASATRMLSPPALFSDKAVLIVRGSRESQVDDSAAAEEGNRNVQVIRNVNQSIKVLETLSKFAPSAPIKLLSAQAEDEEYDATWNAHVEKFLRSTGTQKSASQPDRRAVVSDGVSDDQSSFAQRKFQGRTDLDFTEQFWESILVQAKSFSQVVRALQLLIQALTAGSLLPYIHKSNDTLLGKVCRQAIQVHMAKARGLGLDSSSTGARALETYTSAFATPELTIKAQRHVADNLLQLGEYALGREFAFRFEELGVDKDVLASFASPGHKSQLARFKLLSLTCKLVWTALTFRCPPSQAKALALASLKYATTSGAGAPCTPTFLLSLNNTQLPWVSDEAAGLSALPVARFWQLFQRDREGRISQLCRVASDGYHKPHAKASLSSVAARKLLEMCGSDEPEDLINAFVAREYQQQQQEEEANEGGTNHNMSWMGLLSRRIQV